jgi:hypothetical protein
MNGTGAICSTNSVKTKHNNKKRNNIPPSTARKTTLVAHLKQRNKQRSTVPPISTKQTITSFGLF